MRMALAGCAAIVRNEVRQLFLAPAAWMFLAAFQFLGGLFFTMTMLSDAEASMRPVMANLVFALVFCLPLLTMHQLADEARTGTLDLILSAPVPIGSLVLGKWLGALMLCGVMLALSAPYPVLLWWYADPDPGQIFTVYAGLACCCGAFAAAGLFVSSLTRDPMVAGVGGVVLLLPFWSMSLLSERSSAGTRSWSDSVSVVAHLHSFARGVLDLGDVVWFAAFSIVFLIGTWQVLASKRWAR